MENPEIEKSMVHLLVEVIEYVPKAVLSKIILRKNTGNISISSVDTGEDFSERISPFDTFIQIIDGKAEILIEGASKMLIMGEGIVIPAHKTSSIKANERFKMISTVIKSGYE